MRPHSGATGIASTRASVRLNGGGSFAVALVTSRLDQSTARRKIEWDGPARSTLLLPGAETA
jgi:hypothetical protein